jgi:hypothetical protein
MILAICQAKLRSTVYDRQGEWIVVSSSWHIGQRSGGTEHAMP